MIFLSTFLKSILRQPTTRWVVEVFISLVSLFFLLHLLFPLPSVPSFSTTVRYDNGDIFHVFLSDDDKWRLKLEMEEISPELESSFLFKEDRWFYYHPGINPMSMIRAFSQNLTSEKRVSGASTITMQVARLLEPKQRTYTSKLIEIFRAFQLELTYSKKEILQLYLNLIPFGGNIEGIQSASLIYLQRKATSLSLSQIVSLSLIPNNPNYLIPGIHNERIDSLKLLWLDKMKNDSIFSLEMIESAKQEKMKGIRRSPPKLFPQIAQRLKSTYSQLSNTTSTISPNIQSTAQRLTTNYIQRQYSKGIYHASIFIIDNQTGKVVSYIGSPEVPHSPHQSFVDGVRAVRSPGSTLKPFLYTLSFDLGFSTPKTIISDIPFKFSGYSPENFDLTFKGYITTEKALIQSLNIPAVKMLDQLSVLRFLDKLSSLGFQKITADKEKLGLSLILGGCGVTLEELTVAYSVFAHSGKLKPPTFIATEQPINETQIFTKDAVFMTNQILSQLTRPDLPNFTSLSTNLPKIAWKTGTSYGRRDAWSVGYNKHFTVGVWVGNFSGIGSPLLAGADIATPLLFDIFNAIGTGKTDDWMTTPASPDFRVVCSLSGLPPADFCSSTTTDFFIPGISSNLTCTHLKEVFVNASETHSYCTTCLPVSGYKTKLYPNHSQDMLTFFSNQRVPLNGIPEHLPTCSRIFTESPPVITSLFSGKEYLIEKNSGQELALTATADGEIKKLFWYINDRFYQSTDKSKTLFYKPTQGSLKVSVSDDKGRQHTIFITVKEF